MKQDAGNPSAFAQLRIVATTDVHSHVCSYDYYADRTDPDVGLEKAAGLIQTARDEVRNAVLVDNGDYLQGNPMGDFIAQGNRVSSGEAHPVIKAMNALGYDAGTLGNHEFNYGVPYLDAVNAGARHPIVCANFGTALGDTPLQDTLHLAPFVILDRTIEDETGGKHALRIGLIGFLPPQVMKWDHANLSDGYAARDIVEAAQAWVPEMRSAGADVVIALCHSGITADAYTPGMENASLHLAAVAGIDAIVAGHSHQHFPGSDFSSGGGIDTEAGTLMGKPAVMAGWRGDHIGIIDLGLAQEKGSWSIRDSSAGLRHVDVTARCPDDGARGAVRSAAAEEHKGTLAYIRRTVAETTAPLNTYFSLITPDPCTAILSAALRWQAEKELAGTPWQNLPLLTAAAPIKAGGRGGPDYFTDIPAGPLAVRNIADLCIYPNNLRILQITGAELLDWMERSASTFNQIEPGSIDQPLLDHSFPSYDFDVISGVQYEIDLSQPRRFGSGGTRIHPTATRIQRAAFEGAPIEASQTFLLATNDYRAGGGGNFPGARPEEVVLSSSDSLQDILCRFLQERAVMGPFSFRPWRFAALDQTSVIFETSPRAIEHVSAQDGVELEFLDIGVNGFARFRLTL